MATSLQSEVKASMLYLARNPIFEEEKLFTIYADISHYAGAISTNFVPHLVSDVAVKDVRSRVSQLDLDIEGFEAVEIGQTFPVAHFQDHKWIESVFYPFISKLVLDKLKAKELHVYEHQVSWPCGVQSLSVSAT